MDISNHIKNNLLKLKVIPNSSKSQFIEKDNQLRLYLKSPPEKDKANHELLKFFKKQYNLKVEFKSGKKSREKVLKIRDKLKSTNT